MNAAWAKLGLGGVQGATLYIPSLEVLVGEGLSIAAISAALSSLPTTMVLNAMAAFDFQHAMQYELALAAYNNFIDMRMREEAFYDELPYLIVGFPGRVKWWLEYIPVMIQLEMEAKERAAAEAKAKAEAEFWATMAWLGGLIGFELDAEALWALALELPPFAFVSMLIDVLPKIPAWAHRFMWAQSLMELWYDNEMNPLAWVGDHFAARNVLRDSSYTRLSYAAPQDSVFYAMIPWAYEWLWSHLIYTWEPVLVFAVGTIDFWRPILWWLPLVGSKVPLLELFGQLYLGFTPVCPAAIALAMQAALKIIRVFGWLLWPFVWLFRFFLLIFIAIKTMIIWVLDLIWFVFALIRDFFYFYIFLPIYNIIMFLMFWIIWLVWAIISIILYIQWLIFSFFWWIFMLFWSFIQLIINFFIWLHLQIYLYIVLPIINFFIWLYFAFLWLRRFIISIIWAIVLPILQFFFWLVMFIPWALWTYILVPIMLALAWLFELIVFIVLWLPRMIYLYIILPIINFFIAIQMWIYWNILYPIIYMMFYLPRWYFWKHYMPIIQFYINIGLWIYWNIFFKIQSWFDTCLFGAIGWFYSMIFRIPEFYILYIIAIDGTCFEIASAYEELFNWMASLFADPFWTPSIF